MERFLTLLSIYLLISIPTSADQIYKYKDQKGNWIFTDRKPTKDIEVVTIKKTSSNLYKSKPKIYTLATNKVNYIFAQNPYYAPIEVQLKIKSTTNVDKIFTTVVPGNSKFSLYESNEEIGQYHYTWVMGSPEVLEKPYIYHLPISSFQGHHITQSFNGSFSHHQRPNKYAVDIAMPIGTYISAAREGTVIWVKDDYHMGGAKEYFLDKANFVSVLHEDGTYATYTHILQGTSLVKPGDKVKSGDLLARSGSSGFSTGPHLHFVVRKNIGLSTVSVPFQFIGDDGEPFNPQRGMTVFNAPD
ncbi:peptidoglycan DD-metalloendopeptidase family protein [Microbulbifer variabilis]|uniref:peptidoglycan DD-metalloendopeptidase family protein n=1 Tax=Microbulbifer variabilis TaxID=266805 RepID=UPI001CFF328B|nr:peptidoglycan DD-metalloendopeptidase family protein [Microbulbifer variabilis]